MFSLTITPIAATCGRSARLIRKFVDALESLNQVLEKKVGAFPVGFSLFLAIKDEKNE